MKFKFKFFNINIVENMQLYYLHKFLKIILQL